MIISVPLSLVAIFITLVAVQLLWQKKLIPPELARKLVHIVVGIIVASWMFYMTTLVIVSLATAMFVVVAVSKKLNIFSAIHSISRKTYGELYFALGIIVAALLTDSPWIFAAAILHVSLADGLAGVVGSYAKKPIRYEVFKHYKSLFGTATFFFVSASIFATAIYYDPVNIPNVALPIVGMFSLVVALVENVSPYGSDDLVVPIVVITLLETVSFIG